MFLCEKIKRMIKSIIISSRKEMIDFLNSKPSIKNDAIISICSCEEDIIITEDIKRSLDNPDVLTLIFKDYTRDMESSFNDELADKIISFLDELKNKEKKRLYIHCDAGISRSGAVGVFACRYLDMDETEFLKYNRVSPNSFVYDILAEKSGLRDKYQKFWENIPENIRLLRYKIRFI